VKGTGLGLAIVREYVVAHGGKVEIIDSRGIGAHFQVRLPAAPAHAR
jgi:two-component system sensor histidine kinase GlrK